MRQLVCVFFLASALLAQSSAQNPTTKPDAQSLPQTSRQAASGQPNDELAQMRDDLSKLESLNQNMSAEIEFLRDQNLQILLRTNSQMWGLLIRDLRRQIEREEQRRGARPESGDHDAVAKPSAQ